MEQQLKVKMINMWNAHLKNDVCKMLKSMESPFKSH